MKTALVVGVSGQDGAYLSALLLDKGYRVVGTGRSTEPGHFWRLERLGIIDRVELEALAPTSTGACIDILNAVEPDEVYNLAAQSSVSLSFQKPLETYNSICPVVANLLESIRVVNPQIRFYNAGSGEIFGSDEKPFSETSPRQPCSPYGVAKLSAQLLTNGYRDIYGLYACTGLLFNHESPLRGQYYVTEKIISGAVRIAKGDAGKLNLGNIEIRRDWGWAPEYVEAMWLMLQQDRAEDYVIATGSHKPLRDFIDIAFSHFGLDYRDHVDIDPGLFREHDIRCSSGDSRRARADLGWEPKVMMADVVRRMIEHKLGVGESRDDKITPISKYR